MKASVLEFRLGEDTFCFNTKDIEYVFELERYTKIAKLNSAVLGIVKYNKDVMPLVDTLQLYSSKPLDMKTPKSVVVIHNSDGALFGMMVDEILEIEELDIVHPSVDINSKDMVINHYRDKEKIVNEIYPLPLLKKNNIVAMQYKNDFRVVQEDKVKEKDDYLLFRIEKEYFAIASKYVKEVVENNTDPFYLRDETVALLGAIALRNEVIAVANLNKNTQSEFIVIVEKDGKKVAFFVDEVYDIEEFLEAKIEKLNIERESVNAFYNFNTKVVGLLNLDYFIDTIDGESREQESLEEVHEKEEFLLFYMGDEKFAISMEVVRQVTESELLSKTDSSSIISDERIKFITTWNKTAVSVADISSYFGIMFCEENTQTIFIEADGKSAAFLVSDVDDIVYLRNDEVKRVQEDGSIMGGSVVVDNEVLMCINEKFLLGIC
jgi:chemotaxis signal transduction protein